MGLDYAMQLFMSGVLNVTKLVWVSTSLWTINKVGRQALLMFGSTVIEISHIITAALVGLAIVRTPYRSTKATGRITAPRDGPARLSCLHTDTCLHYLAHRGALWPGLYLQA